MKFLWAIAAVGLVAAAPQGNTLVDQHFATSAAPTVRVELGSADLSVTASSSDRVHIVVRKEGSGEIPTVQVSRTGNRITVSTQTENGPWWKQLWEHHHYADLAVAIEAPAGTALHARVVNGTTTVTNVTGPLALSSVNGAILATGTGADLDADSVNGRIELTVAVRSAHPHLKIGTVNGRVVLRLPRGWNDQISTRTINGAVTDPFSGSSGPNAGKIGTVNGSITIATTH